MRENYEESQCLTYYDATIKRLATRAEIDKRVVNSPNNRDWWMRRFWANMERLALLESDEWCEKNYESTVSLSVEDNGVNGNGLRLSVNLTGTGSASRLDEPDNGELVVVDLTPRQAMMLARALEGVARMREFDGDAR
ncbi:MAG: hypothetical protein ACE5F6_00470 [Anaerolineae bacterium]